MSLAVSAARAVFLTIRAFGLEPVHTIKAIRGTPKFIANFRQLRRQRAGSKFEFPFGTMYPCLIDRYDRSGAAKGHYFHQDLLIARQIYLATPERHIDVGSRVDGFVAHVATYREIEVLDIRAQDSQVPNIVFRQADLSAELDENFLECCDSLSCLHALEHFGLGRYGDTVEYDGHLTGLKNLARMLRQGGTLYLSVPIGPARIMFDAHRVFSVRHLLDITSADFDVHTFSYVCDSGDLHENIPLTDAEIENSYGCTYGCGILELTRK